MCTKTRANNHPHHSALCSLYVECMFSSLTMHSSVLRQVELNWNHGKQTGLDQQQKCVCTVSSYCCRTTEGTTAQEGFSWNTHSHTCTLCTCTCTHRVGRKETFVSASVSRKQQSCWPEQWVWVEHGLNHLDVRALISITDHLIAVLMSFGQWKALKGNFGSCIGAMPSPKWQSPRFESCWWSLLHVTLPSFPPCFLSSCLNNNIQ